LYKDLYSEEIVKKLSKLKKKDQRHHQIVIKKITQIRENPEHRYKDLHHDMKELKESI
jgi:hypothetical protein